jgi:hypothetical protein
MISIKRNELDYIISTFTELMENPNNYILLELISEFDKKRFYYILYPNLSPNKRYDSYEIQVTQKSGFYIYNAFEQESDSNLDHKDGSVIGMVETGRLKIN